MEFMKPLNLFKELLKRKPSNRGRLLGLCINDEHVDLAVSDPDNLYAVPLSAVRRHEGNMDLMADKFRNLISKHDLTGFVVDYSYERSMSRCNATTIKNFIFDLCKTGEFQGLKYTYWDNLIATKHMDFVVRHHVGFILENLNLPQLRAKEIADKFVAARLLQGYLDFVNVMIEHEKDEDPFFSQMSLGTNNYSRICIINGLTQFGMSYNIYIGDLVRMDTFYVWGQSMTRTRIHYYCHCHVVEI